MRDHTVLPVTRTFDLHLCLKLASIIDINNLMWMDWAVVRWASLYQVGQY